MMSAGSGGTTNAMGGSQGASPSTGGSSPVSKGSGGTGAVISGGGSSGGGGRGGGSGGGATQAQGGTTATANCSSLTRARLKNGECVDRFTEFYVGGAPSTLGVGADNMLWLDDGTGQIYQVDTRGQIHDIYSVGDPMAQREFVTGSDDTLIWFTDNLARTLTKVSAKDKLITSYPLGIEPMDVTRGSGNSFWIPEFNKAVYRFTITDAANPVQQHWDANPLSSITTSPDGTLWLAADQAVIKMKPDGTKNSLQAMDGFIFDICPGPDGAVWFTESFYSRIGRVDVNGKMDPPIDLPLNTNPRRIVAGPDKALWFVEQGPYQIGRVSLKGEVTHYPLPTFGEPVGIVLGPDGNLWFTVKSIGKIVRLIPDQ